MPRKAVVTVVSFGGRGGPTIGANLEKARSLLEVACAQRPDIVCLPETFATMNVPGAAAELALPIPGPASEMAAAFARRYGAWVICPFLASEEGRVYNTALVLNRQGEIAARYRKVHPVTTTADYTVVEGGVTPGVEPLVFDTDFGRIGILICFDVIFPEAWAELKRQGAELVFWPSAYNGGFPLQVYAGLHHYYVASAVTSDRSRFVDITGHLLLVGDRYSSVLTMTLDLDKHLYHLDWNGSQIPAILARYGPAVTIRTFQDDAMFTLESNRADLSVAQIEAEFGLETLDGYRQRHLTCEPALREGRKPEPQPTAYSDHPEYV